MLHGSGLMKIVHSELVNCWTPLFASFLVTGVHRVQDVGKESEDGILGEGKIWTISSLSRFPPVSVWSPQFSSFKIIIIDLRVLACFLDTEWAEPAIYWPYGKVCKSQVSPATSNKRGRGWVALEGALRSQVFVFFLRCVFLLLVNQSHQFLLVCSWNKPLSLFFHDSHEPVSHHSL